MITNDFSLGHTLKIVFALKLNLSLSILLSFSQDLVSGTQFKFESFLILNFLGLHYTEMILQKDISLTKSSCED